MIKSKSVLCFINRFGPFGCVYSFTEVLESIDETFLSWDHLNLVSFMCVCFIEQEPPI